MAGEISRVCGPREADGYLRFVDFARRLWQLERADFIDRNLDAPARPASPRTCSGCWPPGGFRRLAAEDRPVLPRPANPADLLVPGDVRRPRPARTRWRIYAVIAYLDSVAGVYFPRGGMHAVPRALAGAAEKHGVRIRYDTTVSRVETSGRPGHRRCTPPTASGSPADVVVLNPDLPVAYRDLLPPRPDRAVAGCATRRPAWCCTSARRQGYQQDRPPQHPLRTGVAGHLRRGDPTTAG